MIREGELTLRQVETRVHGRACRLIYGMCRLIYTRGEEAGMTLERVDADRVTIQDVADAAGVSRAAVSKVIRDAYGVSPAMKERVLATIERLDYRPSVSARGMRGATLTFGIEIPEFANQYFTKIIAGVTESLVDTPYQLIIAPTERSSREGYRAIQALADRQVDGIIAVSPLVKSDWLEDFARRVPTVMLGRHDAAQNYDTVVGDDETGTRLVMDHLLGLGHSDIVHLAPDEAVTVDGSGTPHSIRQAGYLSAMRDAGHQSLIRIERSDNSENGAYLATSQLLDAHVPTAIFAGNDEPALGVLRALADRGLHRSVSVVGYDDTDAARHPLISLTSVAQSGTEMGRHSVELLMERIAGRTDSVHKVFAPELTVRASSGPVGSVLRKDN
jgi:LacI family transcriptional regulator